MVSASAAPKTFMEKVLDGVERVGNKVPHPAVIFVILIGIVIVLSHIMYLLGSHVTYHVINPDTHKVETATTTVRSLLTAEGIRFMFAGVVQNFMNFQAVGVIIVAMVGVGVAEESGLVKALIRKLVVVAPAWALTYILVGVGILSSLAADAGYLVLIPLAAAAFISVGRHPLAGLAAGFAAVASVFLVNVFIVPIDGILTGITNDAIHIVDREQEHLADGKPLVLGGLGDRDGPRRRGDHRPDCRAAARPVRGGPSDREHRDDGRGIARLALLVLGPDRCDRLHRPAGRCRRAPRCGIRRPARSSATRRS